jgi:hypothetical protein
MEAFAQVAPSSSGGDSLWTLMGKVGLTADLIANPAELVEPVFQLKVDPRLALGISPESPARMADAFSIFANGGTYHNLAMVRSVTVQGKQVWTYRPAGSTVLDEAGPPASSVTSQSAVVPTDMPGTIGGDDTAWYAGYQGDTVTTVGLWDQGINAKDQTIEHSLAGLGGLPAQDSFKWAESIWNADMKTISSPNPGSADSADSPDSAESLSTGIAIHWRTRRQPRRDRPERLSTSRAHAICEPVACNCWCDCDSGWPSSRAAMPALKLGHRVMSSWGQRSPWLMASRAACALAICSSSSASLRRMSCLRSPGVLARAARRVFCSARVKPASLYTRIIPTSRAADSG